MKSRPAWTAFSIYIIVYEMPCADSASESAQNSDRSSASPRIVSLKPRPATIERSSSFGPGNRPAPQSALMSVLRRWPKAARTVRKNIFSSRGVTGGAARMASFTTAESTFGGGRKEDAGTTVTISGIQCRPPGPTVRHRPCSPARRRAAGPPPSAP